MKRVLVSACLLGEEVRYDKGSVAVDSPILQRWIDEGRVISLCPEVASGLPVPRPPAEICAGSVLDRTGRDVTGEFAAAAQLALSLARAEGVLVAVLKDRSPSCGSSMIHNGAFDGGVIAGEGVTAALLRRDGIAVFSENELERADRYLTALS